VELVGYKPVGIAEVGVGYVVVGEGRHIAAELALVLEVVLGLAS
jgi:hypothetical protein